MTDAPPRDAAVRGAARTAAFIAAPIALLVGVVIFWLLGGFGGSGGVGGRDRGPVPPAPGPRDTGAVSMPAPTLADRPAAVCRDLLSRLPDRLREAQRRPVSAGPGQNAAYGTPPLTVTCGAAAASPPPDAFLHGLSGVCWYAQERPPGAVYSTVDREVPLTVTLPTEYPQPGQWVIEFSAAIIAAVPPAPNPPSGCLG